MSKNTNQKMRIVLAQKLDELLFEKENAKRCHKWVYNHYAKYILGVSYDTYLNYIDREKHNYPEVKMPKEILDTLKGLKRLDEDKWAAGKKTNLHKHGRPFVATRKKVTEVLPEDQPEKVPVEQY